MCHPLQSANTAPRGHRSAGWWMSGCSNTLSGMGFIRRCSPAGAQAIRRRFRRQAGCMAKAETRRRAARLPKQVETAIAAAEDKKALDLAILDLRKTGGFTDYFVICSGANPRQIRAIADAVLEALAADGVKPAHVEGYDRSVWVLLDYFDFVVHIFGQETRLFYGLER